MLQTTERKWTYCVFALWVLLVVYFTAVQPVWKQTGYKAIISWDALGYYLYLPAQFIHHDLLHLKFLPELMDKYHPSSYTYQAFALPNGNWHMNYTMGLSILFLPFFLLGHLAATLLHVPADGMTWPYQLAIHLCGTFYSLLGLWIARKVLLKFFTEKIAAVTLLLLIIATNYYHYSLLETAMQHTYLFFLYTLLLWLTIKWHEQPKWKYAGTLGLTIGMMALMRPTEIIACLIPLLWGIKDKASLEQKWLLIKNNYGQLIVLAICVIVMGVPQLVYWKIATGHFFFYSYGNVGFNFGNPHITDGLYSYKKGWLLYTPIMVFALLGYIMLYRRYRYAFVPLTVYLVLNIYIVFSWSNWWYGGGFGARALVQSYAVLILPLGMLVQWATIRKATTIILLLVGSCCAALNLFQDWQMRHDLFSSEGMHDYDYTMVFLQTKVDKARLYAYDNQKPMPLATFNQSITVFEKTDWNKKTDFAFHDTSSLELLANKIDILLSKPLSQLPIMNGEQWLQVKAQGFFVEYEWYIKNHAKLTATICSNDGKVVKQSAIRLQHLIGNDTIKESNDLYGKPRIWGEVELLMEIPKNLNPNDNLTIALTNFGQQTVYLDNIKIELLSK